MSRYIEGNPRKGPKGKNPWVELDGERIGDSELIIDLLKDRHAIDLDEGLSSDQLATGHAWRRTFEEHYHQVLEWELFFHPAGAAWMRKSLASQMPAVLAGPVFTVMRSQFRKQLYARGIARHEPDIIAHKGRADLDALAAFLGDRPFLLTDRPTSADTRRVWPARPDRLLVDGNVTTTNTTTVAITRPRWFVTLADFRHGRCDMELELVRQAARAVLPKAAPNHGRGAESWEDPGRKRVPGQCWRS